MSFKSTFLQVGAAALVGCGGTVVDLGGDEGWSTALDLGETGVQATLFHGRAEVLGIAVDDTKLYALLGDLTTRIESNPDGTPGARPYALVSCTIDSCAATLRTLVESKSIRVELGLTLSSGELFWIVDQSVVDQASVSLLACPISGCASGPRVVTDAVDSVGLSGLPVADDGHVYWMGRANHIVRCVREGCATPDLIRDGGEYTTWDGEGQLAISGDDLYVRYVGSNPTLWRFRRDGSGEATLIYRGSRVGGFAVDARYLYLTTSVLTGQLLRCPLSGCEGRPDILVSKQYWPLDVRVDAVGVYWSNAGPGAQEEADRASFEACSIAGGEPRTIASNLRLFSPTGGSNFIMNSRYLFWCEQHNYGPDGYFGTIRVVKK